MGKWIAIAAAGILLAAGAWIRMDRASEKERPVTIGVLQFTKNNLTTLAGFKAGLLELGYVEGENIRYLFDGPAEKVSELAPMMDRLLAQEPDLIFTSPTPATLAAQRATEASKIPIVFAPVNDPVAAGIVSNIRQPGENITGIRLAASDGRRLQWLKEMSPGLSRVFLPYSAKGKSALTSFRNAREAAEKLKIDLVGRPVEGQDDLSAALSEIPDNVDAIFLPRDGMVMSRIADFVALSIEKKMMLSTPRLKQVEVGALTGYGFIGYELGKQAARLADKILRGTPAGDLPVETAEDYLFVNLKTAEAIALPVGDHILRQARDVIRPD